MNLVRDAIGVALGLSSAALLTTLGFSDIGYLVLGASIMPAILEGTRARMGMVQPIVPAPLLVLVGYNYALGMGVLSGFLSYILLALGNGEKVCVAKACVRAKSEFLEAETLGRLGYMVFGMAILAKALSQSL